MMIHRFSHSTYDYRKARVVIPAALAFIYLVGASAIAVCVIPMLESMLIDIPPAWVAGDWQFLVTISVTYVAPFLAPFLIAVLTDLAISWPRDSVQPLCDTCGYILSGIGEARCPECGAQL